MGNFRNAKIKKAGPSFGVRADIEFAHTSARKRKLKH
jgi:hypothetical protein